MNNRTQRSAPKPSVGRLWPAAQLLCALCLLLTTLQGLALPPNRDPSFFNGSRWALDVGSRAQGERVSEGGLMSFLGLDFFSDLHFGGRHRGDIVAQVYLFDMRPYSADGGLQGGQFDYAPCVIAPNLILLPQGKMNLKFGHIWHGYGLRNQINTTQTLRQLISQQNMGLMLDWGAELYGELNLLSYSVSLGSGSGKWFSRQNGTYMSSMRLGLYGDHPSLFNLPVKLGLSGLSAKFMSPQGLIERWRAGLDLEYDGPVGLLLEGSVGEDLSVALPTADPREALSLFAELHWRSPSEQWMLYVQQRHLSLALDPAAPAAPDPGQMLMDDMMGVASTQEIQTSTLGVLYSPLRSLYLASELVYRGEELGPLGRIQVRYRW